MGDRYGSSFYIQATMPWVHYCLKLAERLVNFLFYLFLCTVSFFILFFIISRSSSRIRIVHLFIYFNVQRKQAPRGNVQPRSSEEWPCEAAVNRLASNAFKSPLTFSIYTEPGWLGVFAGSLLFPWATELALRRFIDLRSLLSIFMYIKSKILFAYIWARDYIKLTKQIRNFKVNASSSNLVIAASSHHYIKNKSIYHLSCVCKKAYNRKAICLPFCRYRFFSL